MVFLKDFFFEKVDFEKYQQMTKVTSKITQYAKSKFYIALLHMYMQNFLKMKQTLNCFPTGH